MSSASSTARPFLTTLVLTLLTACGSGPTGENSSTAGVSVDSTQGISLALPMDPPSLVTPAALPNLRCDGNAGGPRYSYYSVTAQLSSNKPVNVLSFPTYNPSAPTSYRATAVAVTNYPGYPQYKVWNVTGHANGIGTPGDLYYLLLPRRVPGPGVSFNAELHILFNRGQNGWWQVLSVCSVS